MNIKTKLKQLFCFHKFKSNDTDCKYSATYDTYTITETCYKCGKKFSFTAPSKNFGLKKMHMIREGVYYGLQKRR